MYQLVSTVGFGILVPSAERLTRKPPHGISELWRTVGNKCH